MCWPPTARCMGWQQSNTILPAIIHPLCVCARPRARVFVCMVSFAGGVNQVQKHVRQLVECAHGARSEELLLHAALATKRAHTAFVPWLTVDGAAVVCCPLPCVRVGEGRRRRVSLSGTRQHARRMGKG